MGTDWNITENDGEDKIVRVIGKNSSTFVPILIGRNLVPIVSLFIDGNVRKTAGISPTNPYVFASRKSDDCICGSNELNNIINELGIENLNATKMRHFVATHFNTTQTLTEDEQPLYYQQFGHRKAINEKDYKSYNEELERRVANKVKNVVRGECSKRSISPTGDSLLSIDERCSTSETRLVNSPSGTPVNDSLTRNDVSPVTNNRNIGSPIFRKSLFKDQLTTPKRNSSKTKKNRWSNRDNQKIKAHFKNFIEKMKCKKPSNDQLKKFVRENSLDYIPKSEADTPSRSHQLLRKLYNEQRLYKERIEKINHNFLSP